MAEKYRPLADELRPTELDDVVGQSHILGPDGLLRRIIESGQIPNMIFYGPSGTGKTTVARILAGLLHELGLLTGSEILEVGRADLVARYVGQTADKVREVFKKARGRLLFIDEAYSLVDGERGEFGDEAINTIVQEMENRREETVVVFAGYPEEMDAFFAQNPGLRSRVPFRIRFADYSAAELLQIAEAEAEKRGFTLSPEGRARAAELCEAAACRPAAGNGRFCRNLVEAAVLGYAARVYGTAEETPAGDFTLTAEDFRFPDGLRPQRKPPQIGFAA